MADRTPAALAPEGTAVDAVVHIVPREPLTSLEQMKAVVRAHFFEKKLPVYVVNATRTAQAVASTLRLRMTCRHENCGASWTATYGLQDNRKTSSGTLTIRQFKPHNHDVASNASGYDPGYQQMPPAVFRAARELVQEWGVRQEPDTARHVAEDCGGRLRANAVLEHTGGLLLQPRGGDKEVPQGARRDRVQLD